VFTCAPDAIPSNFDLSVEDIKPALLLFANGNVVEPETSSTLTVIPVVPAPYEAFTATF